MLKNKFPIILTLIFVFCLILYWGRFGSAVVDCGREAFIPYSMAYLGKVLYKDIVCIYGPVPYYLNAFMVRLFGANLAVMQLTGALISIVFLGTFFCLTKRLAGGVLAFLSTLLVLFSCVFSSDISNFIFPYSYAALYASCFALLHLFFSVKYIETPSCRNLSLAALFLSLCLFSKADFLPCVLPFAVLLFFMKDKIPKKAFCSAFLAFLAPAFAVFCILAVQKVTISDFSYNLKTIVNMAHSPSLKYFYTICTGYFFEFRKTFMFVPQFIGVLFVLLLAFSTPIVLSKIKNRYLYFGLNFALCLFLSYFLMTKFYRYIFIYLPLLVLAFAVWKIVEFTLKKPAVHINQDVLKISFIVVFSLLASLKSLFGLFHELYGTFYLPFILLSAYLCLALIFKNRENAFKSGVAAVITTLILVFAVKNAVIFMTVKNFPLETPAGTYYTTSDIAKPLNEAYTYLEKKLTPDDTLVPLPEGLLFNFALQKDYPPFNTSFTPMDFDAYGEERLTESFLANPPDYLLILPRDCSDYGKAFLCKDFGLEFCQKINSRFTFERVFSSNAGGYSNFIYLFKRKDF